MVVLDHVISVAALVDLLSASVLVSVMATFLPWPGLDVGVTNVAAERSLSLGFGKLESVIRDAGHWEPGILLVLLPSRKKVLNKNIVLEVECRWLRIS